MSCDENLAEDARATKHEKVMTGETPFVFGEGQMKKWKLVLILGIAFVTLIVFLPSILGMGNSSISFRNIGRIVYP